MHDRAWQVPEAAFAAAWNGAASLDDGTERVRELAGGRQVPRWTMLARAAARRKAGRPMKELRPANAA